MRSKSDDGACSVDKLSRTISITGDIDRKVASKFRRYVKELSRTDQNTITIEINTPGGEVEAGLSIVDTIMLSKIKFITRVAGTAYSMGAIILAAGDVRQMFPRSTVMIHEMSLHLHAKASDFLNEAAEVKRLEGICWDIMDKQTKKPKGYWNTRCDRKELYLSPQLAKEAGLIHEILKSDG